MYDQARQLFSNLRAAWHYRWFGVAAAWILALGGWAAVHRLPDRHEATARVHVNTQSVLKPLLSGLAVQPNVEQMVTMMGRTLINRPNLERIIGMAGIDARLKTTDEREQLIGRLSKELTIKSAGTENLYTISYTDRDANEAKQIVQSLLTIFVEQSVGDQKKDSDDARLFIDDQLKTYNEKLIASENAIADFKRRNLGLMPGEGRDYYARLVEAQGVLSQAALELKEAENARDSIKKQLSGEFEVPSLLADKGMGDDSNPDIDARIQALEQKLDGLRLTYTERHPDIVALLRSIAQLKEQKKVEAKLRKPSPTPSQDPVHQQLTISLASADANVAAMRARVAEFGKRYDVLKAAAHAVPQIDAQYAQLTRDYEVTKKNYENLLSRREAAQISGAMEARASVTDFRVVDPPVTATRAYNRRLLNSIVLLLALGGGLGFAFLLSQIRPMFDDEGRLEAATGVTVLGTVAMAWTDEQKALRTRRLVAFVMSFASLLSAYFAIMVALTLTVSRA